MSYLKRPLGGFFLLVMIILGAQVALKKPLCIDSSVVYKIDRTDRGKTESIYSCSQFKKVSFSRFFHEKLDLLENHLRQAEMTLQHLDLPSQVSVHILAEGATPENVAANAVSVSEADLGSGALTAAIIEAALRGRTGSADREYLETLTDFFGSAKKSRGLISQAWAAVFADHGFFEKQRVSRRIARRLRNSYVSGDDAISNLHNLLRPDEAGAALTAAFTAQLEKRGYISREGLAGRSFDVIVDVTGAHEKVLAAELLALARRYPERKLAFKTAAGLFLLPSVLRVPDELAAELHSEYRLIFTGRSITPGLVRAHLATTERLVFVEEKSLEGGSSPLNLRPLFIKGMNGFLAANPQMNFVQLHLPSYRLKSSALNGIQDYFSFVRGRELLRKEHRVLGWQKTEWLKDLQAYRPLAHFDVIQYFRIN